MIFYILLYEKRVKSTVQKHEISAHNGILQKVYTSCSKTFEIQYKRHMPHIFKGIVNKT